MNSVRGAKYNAFDSAFEDYYPFGKGWENPAYSSNFDKYTYNGKEMQTTGWLPYLDYGARMYDPRIGRWFGPDPLAEKYYSTSPYAFCANNPINMIDVFGLQPQSPHGPGGTYNDLNGTWNIDEVVITGSRPDYSMDGRLWFALNSLKYANYGPTKSQSSVSVLTNGGGGGSNDVVGIYKKRGSVAEKIDNANNFVEEINDLIDLATALANALTENKYQAIGRLGDITTGVGIATSGVDIGITTTYIFTGQPWAESAIDAAIGIVGLFGLPGLFGSVVLGSYKNGFMYLYDQYENFEQHANESMMSKIVPGYRP